ncbi:hypothetical protein AYX14_05244 [Cryptococcus neoformans]|nr:hypothetical protein AYX14_05244 [Cryptococcus neoformans var. grubii]
MAIRVNDCITVYCCIYDHIFAANFASLRTTTPQHRIMSARGDAYMSDEDQSQARPQRSGAVKSHHPNRPSSMIHPLGSVSAYHAERQGEAYRWDAQLQLWTKVVTVGESETLEGAWLRREWLDVINKKMNPSVGWWCKSKHVPEELVARTQQWVKEHCGDWKKTSADLHRMGMRAEVYQPLYQR